MMKHIEKGKEISEVIDILFKQTDSKHGLGHFGFMTKGLVTRQHAYQDALIAALSRFIYPEIY